MRRSNLSLNELSQWTLTDSAHPPHDRRSVLDTCLRKPCQTSAAASLFPLSCVCPSRIASKDAERCTLYLSRLVNRVRWMHGPARWGALRQQQD